MSKLSKEQVKNIAKLSRLGIKESEIDKYSKEISDILTYVEQLNEMGVICAEPVSQITGLESVTREDAKYEQKICSKEELLKNAPDIKDDSIKVKPVFEERESI